jgi:adenine-specific DNA methylase
MGSRYRRFLRNSKMIPKDCKRLIEVDFPIAAVSAHSAKEKSIRHGHPSTLHLWWARRPLAACRAVLLGLLLPDPCQALCPADFKKRARELLPPVAGKIGPNDDDLQRALLKFIGDFANWDFAANQTFLEIGRGLVKAAHPEETPVVVDPFAGGGSIPLEALRLGCEAFASDLNPVACLILKTLLEDIPRYGKTDFKLKDDRGKEQVVHGLADALRHVGKQVKQAAEKELVKYYPADKDGSRPIAYLWARTVRCEAVDCGAEIPLLKSFWLCKKAGRRRALRFTVERPKKGEPSVHFEIFTPKSDSPLPDGTVHRADATCPCCHVVLPAARTRSQLAAQHGGADVQFDVKANRTGGALMLAVVTLREGASGRFYRLPTPEDYAAVFATQKAVAKLPKGVVPDEPTPIGGGRGAGRAFGIQNYGMMTFGDLFTARQKVALATLATLVQAQDAAIRDFLALVIDRVASRSSALCLWRYHADQEKVEHIFGRQSLSVVWDFAEAVVMSESTGSFSDGIEVVAQCVESETAKLAAVGQAQLADACVSPLSDRSVNVWFTDPPYYDAIPYADLSDFFFVWLKRALPKHPILRDPYDGKNLLTPKSREIVQDEIKSFEGRPKDGEFFEVLMGRAFTESRRVLKDDGVGCVVFAHKTTEGWEALLTGLLRAGLAITASWPITTEMGNRLRARDSAALAGSVHLVCRPRDVNAGVGDWSEVKAAMEKRIREWLPTLTKHGVRGADAIFSCLGPALESYSRYEKVLTQADREVPLGGDPEASEPHERGFLAYVFETLSKEALRQVLGDAQTEGYEEDARMTALFLWTLQTTKANGNGKKAAEVAEDAEDEGDDDKPTKAAGGFSMPFDTFIRITRPMGIHYPALEGRVIEIEKGVVRLLPVKERMEELLGEAAKRGGAEFSIQDLRQGELFARGATKSEKPEKASAKSPKLDAGKARAEGELTTLDRIHRAMLLFSLGRSALLRQVLEVELRQGKRFERLALSLNSLYPESSDERRMLEGVQSAMRGVK